jgi:hypothetical protein
LPALFFCCKIFFCKKFSCQSSLAASSVYYYFLQPARLKRVPGRIILRKAAYLPKPQSDWQGGFAGQ